MQTQAADRLDQASIHATRLDHVIFITVTLLYWSTLYVYVPILSPFMKEGGYSDLLIGFVLGSYGFTQMFIRFPLGLLSDKLHKRKPFLMLGMLTGAVSCLLFIIPGSWLWPLAGRIMSGVCASAWVAFTVLYAAYFASRDATKAMSNISFMTVTGQLIGMTISGWLAGAYGWNAAFYAGIGIGLTGFVLTFAVKEPREGVTRAPISLKHLHEVVKTPSLIQVSTLSILAHCVLFITMFGFTPLKAVALGASTGQLTAIVIAFMVPHAITSLFSGRLLAPRYGNWNVIAVGFACSAIFTVAIAYSPTLGWLAVTQALNGLAQGLYFPLLLGLAIQPFEPSKRATAMGFYQAIYSVGMFAGPFLAGFINEGFGRDYGFWLGGVFAMMAFVLTQIWKRSNHSGIR
ncbi:putative MFS-type transporter YxlH [Paenibacillus baekrokdamisoli]|uniref:Putative MFS-type transporter YxlH n=1 Tax=Paenibacillus baekrokdamisoli TaxID=1712516 RepID=A0A3G9IPJ1_9BACL|nr:MFS transporter [Paenibacillus baekrokdamisoli]MBB3069859.1 MFS family permease [Paenibacillus baekrokdamisoli]BBH20787.1 putative MFS-type transporter YxlH [Paenibacillus baekrokdamisoli]